MSPKLSPEITTCEPTVPAVGRTAAMDGGEGGSMTIVALAGVLLPPALFATAENVVVWLTVPVIEFVAVDCPSANPPVHANVAGAPPDWQVTVRVVVPPVYGNEGGVA